MANILVVDDELGIRDLLWEILNDEGHTVEVAENAAQARAARLRERPDLVLLDIWMPDTDGVTLLKEWSVSGTLTMPVIMMSGHATIDTAVEATRFGAFDFLEKPITLQKLLAAVNKGLARAHLQKHAQSAPPGSVANVQRSDQLQATDHQGGALAQAAAGGRADGVVAPVAAPFPIELDQPLREARDEFERIYFEHHLAKEHGSMTRVAERTGLERTHLYRKLKQLGVELARGPRRNAGTSEPIAVESPANPSPALKDPLRGD
jgi:DNA-binding NtrC family response regulator